LDFLKSKFTKVALLEHHSNSFTFKMSKDQSSIGYVFGLLEDLKEQYSISEYSVIQTSLEQIFNIFAKEAQITKN